MSVSDSGSGTQLFLGVFGGCTATASKCWKPDDRLSQNMVSRTADVPTMSVFTGNHSGNGNHGNQKLLNRTSGRCLLILPSETAAATLTKHLPSTIYA